jgi:ribosomal protein L29
MLQPGEPGADGGGKPPRVLKSPAGGLGKEEPCENPSCKEARRIERTTASNLKQEVATLKMQLAMMQAQLALAAEEAEAAMLRSDIAASETETLRSALADASHTHGVAVANRSSELAALRIAVAEQQSEIDELKARQAATEVELSHAHVGVRTLASTVGDLDTEVLRLVRAAPGFGRGARSLGRAD